MRRSGKHFYRITVIAASPSGRRGVANRKESAMMSERRISTWIVWLVAAMTAGLTTAGCGPTSVQSTSGTAYTGLPRPERILVYDFAGTPDEVKLDQGISADIMRYVSDSGASARTAEEIKIGHAVAAVVS